MAKLSVRREVTMVRHTFLVGDWVDPNVFPF